ncbi:MAG: hypothetical protein MJ070_06815 [Lachnospiraceae bacterium]|nr:hypothetical protein [Lachnospiraceae bacterium]
MTMMEKVLRSGIDLSPLGFGRDRTGKPLPEGAGLISGVSGGRFLRLSGCRDAVFYEPDGKNAVPVRVSRSFRRFLAVLFAAGDLTALAVLVSSRSLEEWEQYRAAHPKTETQKAVLRQLRELTGIRPSPDPFGEVTVSRITCDVEFPIPAPEPKEYETVGLTEIVF